jgi:4-hydroxy-2-oxoglutarate aldolase
MASGLAGIFAPIPTPFDAATGDVDVRALASNVRRWMGTGLSGLLALGSNGEAPLLDEGESDRVVAAVREAMPSGRPLLVGTGRESTRATIDASVRAARLGADAVLVRAPSYYKGPMTPAALTAHFTAVADASPVPVLLYNLPGMTGFSLTPALVEGLARHPRIAGVKETSTDLERLSLFAAIDPDRFTVLCGSAPVLFPALAAGAAGGILAVANLLPDACSEIVNLTRAGRFDDARARQRRLVRLAQAVTTVHGIAGLKAALDWLGYVGGPVRAPLLPLSADGRREIEAELAAFPSLVRS